MSDRELLELAAKAADIKVEWREWRTARAAEFGLIKHTKHAGFWVGGQQWDPLIDDGDALRLAVKLLFEIDMGRGNIAVRHATGIKILEAFNHNPNDAARRAIVRAAAEIGRAMP